VKSLAIARAEDILRLKSTLKEMNYAGLEFEDKPKEINSVYLEKTLNIASDKEYEVCALIPIVQDHDLSRKIINDLSIFSDVLILDPSDETFNKLARLMKVLPDLDIPEASYKDLPRKSEVSKGKPSNIYLGIFVGRNVKVETSSGGIHDGILRQADSIGVLFEPCDNSSSIFFTWHDIKKIIIPKNK
jgi:hypothetical protein